MAQLRATGDGSYAAIVVRNIQVVGKRFHRVTIEWTLSGQPVSGWIEAFDSALGSAGGFRSHVPSAYGRPMVMRDKTIVWAMFEADAQMAVSLVKRAVSHANAQFDGLLEPI
jgi:hypothetical protein